jgi:hypothetical protein
MSEPADRLVAFVTARYDERERVAQTAAGGGHWRYSGGDSVGAWTLYDEHWRIADLATYLHGDYNYAERMPAFKPPYYVDPDANGEHIALNDPAYVLDDIASKRQILALHTGEHQCQEFVTGTYPPDAHLMGETPGARWEHAMAGYFGDHPCPTLRLLAAPFAAHPDFDPAWAVSE